MDESERNHHALLFWTSGVYTALRSNGCSVRTAGQYLQTIPTELPPAPTNVCSTRGSQDPWTLVFVDTRVDIGRLCKKVYVRCQFPKDVGTDVDPRNVRSGRAVYWMWARRGLMHSGKMPSACTTDHEIGCTAVEGLALYAACGLGGLTGMDLPGTIRIGAPARCAFIGKIDGHATPVLRLSRVDIGVNGFGAATRFVGA